MVLYWDFVLYFIFVLAGMKGSVLFELIVDDVCFAVLLLAIED